MAQQQILISIRLTGHTKAKKTLIKLQKLFDRLVVAGKKAGLTRNEIADMVKLEINK